jgi:putative ABC transport system substrate-binding protein
MRRREFLTLAIATVGCSSIAGAQKSEIRRRRIGFIGGGNPSTGQLTRKCFDDGLRDLGWSEAVNIDIARRWTEGSSERISQIAGDLVSLKPDLIVVTSTPATLAAKAATADIPIVFMLVSDPVGTGIVRSLARPEGNVTGVSNFLPATTAKLLQLSVAVAPRTSRVGVLFNPTNSGKLLELVELRAAADILKVALEPLEVQSTADVEQALASCIQLRCEALITLFDGVTQINRGRITQFAAKERLIGVYQIRDFAEAGGLITYGLDTCRHCRRAAVYVDRILKGTRPSDLPVEQPTEFELIINMKAARELGLTIPPTLLATANDVIE